MAKTAWKWVMIGSLILTPILWFLTVYLVTLYYVGSGDFWLALLSSTLAVEWSMYVLLGLIIWDIITIVMYVRRK